MMIPWTTHNQMNTSYFLFQGQTTIKINSRRTSRTFQRSIIIIRVNKRPRTENVSRSNLAILHEQNQKMVQVKTEKSAAETTLMSVREEKEVVEADLEEVRDDLGDANDPVQQQYLAQDIWQRRFDELVSLVEAGQVDGAMISDIRNRSLARGSYNVFENCRISLLSWPCGRNGWHCFTLLCFLLES
mmetsp:Transcript_38975/g.70205  ORF Transcript_38975/g.70205 Transcript_38975/m.70205 type:complete len:187 (-) Transcript_38975:104-664(-)